MSSGPTAPASRALPAVDGRDLPRRPTWSHLVADAAGIPPVELTGERTLGDVATPPPTSATSTTA